MAKSGTKAEAMHIYLGLKKHATTITTAAAAATNGIKDTQ